MEFLQDDCDSLWSNIQFEEKQLKMKRRWLMGLPTASKSELKRLKTPKFLTDVCLPESLLREDDVSYENVRTSVERGFGALSDQSGHYVVRDYLHLVDTTKLVSVSDISRALPSMLDDMNNIGLFNLANIATGSSINFEKTRWKMKKIIKEHLPKILRNPNHKCHMGLLTGLPQLIKDPRNFLETRVSFFDSTAISKHCAITKIMEGLEDMPSQSLNAMHRRIRGIQVDVGQLQLTKSGWTRARLIKNLRNTCEKMLSEVNKEGVLQEPLAKAMAVAALALKLTSENPNLSMPEFFHFSSETETLHNEILKALRVLENMDIKSVEVKDLQHLLDPKSEISIAHFRATIKRMLIDYLFECSEMDIVPKPLLETLAIINRKSQSVPTMCFSKEDVEKEVESVLNVSSQVRQIAWDLFGEDHEIDEEFSDAYIEDFQESDEDDQRLRPNCSHIVGFDSSDEVESVGESRPVDSSPLSTPDINLNSDSIEVSQPELVTGPDLGISHDFGSSCSSPSKDESSLPQETQNMSGNQYLTIQEICDETSLVAHQLIGRLLGSFLQMKGVDLERNERSYLGGGVADPEDSQDDKEVKTSHEEDIGGQVLVHVVEELLPSFPKSKMERLKELMGLE